MRADRGARRSLRAILALFYAAAGVMHLRAPEPFLLIVPNWVPAPHAVVVFTGACEIAGAAGLLIPRLRTLAGCMLALYAVCVFPANIMHALDNIDVPGLPSSWWYHGPRLMAQPVLVWLALYVSGATDWPFAAIMYFTNHVP